jgi:hypothetical protein
MPTTAARSPTRSPARIAGTVLALGAAAAGLWLGACAKKGQVVRAKEPIIRDMPDVLRGTIGAECTFRGVEPQLVSGFGIVVGLSGTGGGNLDPAVQATMERELARGGVGLGGNNEQFRVSPAQFLRDPNVAVVIVEAAVPPGAPKGMKFDVRVRTLPNSGVTSLEGGTLWTTDLRIGPATVFTGYTTYLLAKASGGIFINPFAEPGKTGDDAVTRTVGRILNGGLVSDPLKLELVLDNESHARSRSIVAAINTRFPIGPGDDGPTARGRDADSVAVRVPAAYRDRPAEFLKLLRHTRIDQALPQEFAIRYVEALKQQPELSDALSWCLRALGKPAVPFLASMYDYPEIAPRLAVLEAGAFLDDPKVVPYLQEMARSGPPGFRTPAIEMLGRLSIGNPRISLALRDLTSVAELDVRVAAYEALAARFDPSVTRTPVGEDPQHPRFFIDTVPATRPLIYITQQGQPRIVIFGGGGGITTAKDALKIAKPLVVSAWSDRLMLAADDSASPLRLFYRDIRSDKPTSQNVPDGLAAFTAFLAHKPTPEDPGPGLNLTYAEVVGALYEIHKQGGVPEAEFATERDRIQVAVLEARASTIVEDRPESSGTSTKNLLVYEPTKPPADQTGTAAASGPKKPSLVVPINPKGASK